MDSAAWQDVYHIAVERTEAEQCAVGIGEEVRVEMNVRIKKASGQSKN